MDGVIADRLKQTFRSVFRNPTLELKPTTTANDVRGWDSLMHVNLIVAIEREFHIRFTTAEIMSLKNVGELADLIARKLG